MTRQLTLSTIMEQRLGHHSKEDVTSIEKQTLSSTLSGFGFFSVRLEIR